MKKADYKKTGVVFNIQKFSVNDGPGIRTVVFFKGCPMHCQIPKASFQRSRFYGIKKNVLGVITV